MTKRQAKTKAVKARKTVRAKKARVVRAKKTVRTKQARATKRTVRTAKTATVFKQPITALQNSVSSFIGYFK